MIEQWKSVPGYEGFYDISNLGRLKSLTRYVPHKTPGKTRIVRERMKAFSRNKAGYVSALLDRYDQPRGKALLHRLVAQAFIPNPLGLPQVNHLDGDKENNAASNLEWCTGSENCQHAIREGLYEQARGESAGNAKLSDADVLEMRRLYSEGGVYHWQLAERFGIGRKAVTKIINRQRWAHI